MRMWVYDDERKRKSFSSWRGEMKRLEKEYLDLRIQLRDTEDGSQVRSCQ